MEPKAKRPVGRPRKTPKILGKAIALAADREMMRGGSDRKSYDFPIKPPELVPGVVPQGVVAPVMATDSAATYSYASSAYPGGGFPGFPYLSNLATRAEYRAFAAALSTELTREWIEFTSKQDDDTSTAEKIKVIEAEFAALNVRGIIQQIAAHDALFGRGQICVDIKGQDRSLPLLLDPRTVRQGAKLRLAAVEPIWTTPSAYNTLDPAAPDFYRPSQWFMLGREIHASRLLTVVTRPLPDILKPAFNFAGMSLSQLAEPYVDNWLRTRQSVSDLINNFSITALATAMDEMLTGDDDGDSLVKRAQLFTTMRSNRGLMVLDKDREELVQINTPLSGLHELQAQSQEQMCSVSRMPAIVLTGISPGGLNASSDSEIRVFYDWIAAQQESYYREPIEIVLKLVQLIKFGEIDPDIGFAFVPLYQMTPDQESDIRLKDSQAATAYINAGVLDPQEERERLARDPNSGYQGLDTSVVPVPPIPPGFGEQDPEQEPPPPGAQDEEFDESKHPRADNGQFGSGGGGGSSKPKRDAKPLEVKFESRQGFLGPEVRLIAGKREVVGWGSQQKAKEFLQAGGYIRLPSGTFTNDPKLGGGGKSAEKKSERQRSPGLSEAHRAIESAFFDRIDADTPGLVGAYLAKNGNLIDPDKVKAFDENFAADPSLAAAVHEPSSELTKVIFKHALDAKAAAGDKSPTVFTAGGSGSGKSTTMPGALRQLGAEPDALIYDSVLSSAKSAKARIDLALETTEGPVGIAYTNADIEQAMIQNAKRTRSVSIDTLANAHAGAAETIRELAEHYADNPRVRVTVMNNLGGIDDVAEGTLDDVPTYERMALRHRLVAVADQLLEVGAIDSEKHRLLLT